MPERRQPEHRDLGEAHDEEQVSVRVPIHLSLRDVILTVGTVVSIVAAWGIVGTRISLLEQRGTLLDKQIERLEKRIDDLEQRLYTHELNDRLGTPQSQLPQRPTIRR